MSARAVILSVGNELITGLRSNTNATYISEHLLRLGVLTEYIQAIADDALEIDRALRQAMARVDIILITGGLGPTEDDLTREAVAEALGRRLVISPETEDLIRKKLGKPTAGQLRQAFIPAEALVIPATTGTAPGICIEEDGKRIYLLPGVPFEMEEMMQASILPQLKGLLPAARRGARVYKFIGVGEVEVEERLSRLVPRGASVGLLPHPHEVYVQVIADWEDLEALDREIPAGFPDEYYGSDGETLPAVVARLLADGKVTLGCVESCTGGLLAKTITDVPGSSTYFIGGLVAYSDGLKVRIGRVEENLLAEAGAVSAEVAEALAREGQALLGSDYCLSVTGIAGPSGGSEEKPVGLVYLGLAHPDGVEVKRHQFGGSRPIIRERTARSALNLLRLKLVGARPS